MRQAGQATPIVHGSDMTAVATVRGVAASVCACLFSAALRNAAMQTAAANVPIQGKRAERSSSVSHWRYAWRAGHRHPPGQPGGRAAPTRQGHPHPFPARRPLDAGTPGRLRCRDRGRRAHRPPERRVAVSRAQLFPRSARCGSIFPDRHHHRAQRPDCHSFDWRLTPADCQRFCSRCAGLRPFARPRDWRPLCSTTPRNIVGGCADFLRSKPTSVGAVQSSICRACTLAITPPCRRHFMFHYPLQAAMHMHCICTQPGQAALQGFCNPIRHLP